MYDSRTEYNCLSNTFFSIFAQNTSYKLHKVNIYVTFKYKAYTFCVRMHHALKISNMGARR